MNPRVVQIIALALTLACLVGSSFLIQPIRAQRDDIGLTPRQVAGVGDASDQRAVSTLAGAAMGAFRGLTADILWYRANRLKEEGKFYEANQLAEWITTLQPSFSAVWVFHAWNMAYNISVATYTPQERWEWVKKGIELLRDRAIPLNPTSVVLYKELGWMYFHKIGQFMDDAHWYYKQRLAEQWEEILGPPIEGGTLEQTLGPLRAIVEAPDTISEFEAQSPQSSGVVRSLERLGYDLDDRLLRQVGRVLMFNVSSDAKALGVKAQSRPDLYDTRLVELVDDPAHEKTLPPVLAYLRKKVLRETYHMDPAFMLKLMMDQKDGGYGFGPIDWRHPAAHSLYWDSLGTEVAARVKGSQNIDLLNTYRGVIHSLQNLTDSGRVSFDPVSGYLDMLPDPRFIPAYEKALELAIQDVRNFSPNKENVEVSYQSGHENFLLKAVVFCYLYGSTDDAQHYYDKARKLYGDKPERLASGMYLLPLPDIVLKELTENIDLTAFSRQFVDAMLARAFGQGLANNRMEVFDRSIDLARQLHARTNKKAGTNLVGEQKRLAMLPWNEVVTESFLGFMKAGDVPMGVRVRAWRNGPVELRQRVFDRLIAAMDPLAKTSNLDLNLAFPAPPGMDEYRKAHPVKPADPKTGNNGPTIERN